ncbi:SbcC/MukB-like Walker B domain-containing protein [Actinoplanes sp. NPDC051475]|uniref:SbcC/MukB-like Walker B domain-containing protein n=1 Tax=Actinoplanes sp. NPDC051475 TaxID=3157225 RepID=UPI00344F027A
MTDSSRTASNVTLFDSFGAPPALVVDALPAAKGRWQPVRAGVVNSWAWVDEQFLFRDGWSTLVGPNGSGKSLTSGLWFPTMLDGNVRPSALSLSQRGAGTLAERHHNRTPSREKTGAWWLEFGRCDEQGAPQWLTLGLWIRWRGDKSNPMEQAWFILPGRVGADLHLQHDDDPVDIDALADQVAYAEGQIFTSHDRLQRLAGRHLSVQEEAAYADAVRVQLFPEVDSDQMEALTSVLRALRSVRVNDRMTPDEMQQTLTSALPALPTQYTELLAKNLGQLDDLQDKVNTAQRERDLLLRLTGSYGRYADSAAAVTAHAALAAFADVHRAEKSVDQLRRDIGEQQTRHADAHAAYQKAEQDLTKLKISADVLRGKTEGHRGRNIPDLADAVKAAHETAKHLTGTAAERQQEADKALDRQNRTSATFEVSARQATALTAVVRQHAEQLSAEPFCEAIGAAGNALTDDLVQPTHLTSDDIPTAADAVTSWAHHRQSVIDRVRSANAEVQSLERTEAQSAQRHADTAGELTAATDELAEAQRLVAEHDEAARTVLAAFNAQHADVLGPVPMQLLAAVPLDPDAITRWADQAVNNARAAIGLPEKTSAFNRAADRAADTAQLLDQADIAAQQATTGAHRIAALIAGILAQLPEPPQPVARWAADLASIDPADEVFDRVADGDAAVAAADERTAALRQAATDVSTAQRQQGQADHDKALAEDAAGKLQTATDQHDQQQHRRDACVDDFVDRVQQWTSSLHVLSLQPHEIPDAAVAREGDLSPFPLHVAGARQRAERPLRDDAARARRHAADLGDELRRLDVRIVKAETEEEAPDAPSWRPERAGRTGAPLWDLVDFAADIGEQRQAAIEGALLVGGILDAWVDPEHSTAIGGDALLRPGPAVDGPSLADVLVAHPTDAISDDYITRILRGIALDVSGGNGLILDGDQLRTPWLTAAAPPGWRPQFIGAAARADRRRRDLEQLRELRAVLEPRVQAAHEHVKQLDDRLALLDQEAQLPSFDELMRARARLAETATALVGAQTAHGTAAERARASSEQADGAWQTASTSCGHARVTADRPAIEAATAACTDLIRHLHNSRTAAQVLAASCERRATRAGEKAAADQAAETTRLAVEDATGRDEQAQRSRTALAPFDELRHALTSLVSIEDRAERAAAAEAAGRADWQGCQSQAEQARARRRAAATTQDGRRLPVEADALDAFQGDLRRLGTAVTAWVGGTQRLIYDRLTAQGAAATASEASRLAATASSKALQASEHAGRRQHELDEERRLYEQPFQKLLDEYDENQREQESLVATGKLHDATVRDADNVLARLDEREKTARQSLGHLREKRGTADGQLLELFDHGLIADVTNGDTYERPDGDEEASAVATRLAQRVPADAARDQLRREGLRLGTELQQVVGVFLRMGRHVVEQEIGTAGLRRIVLADSTTALETGQAKTLKQAAADISRSLQSLQHDYDEQLRKEIKDSLLVQLRGQINTRIQLAHTIVDGIATTLKGVRTGVERVGVRLDWVAREDDTYAVESLGHIRKPNDDGNHDDMYDFFTKRLRDESGDESTAERIARIFDYRKWFTWKIEVTHKEFSDEAHPEEVFREITRKKNPLDTLSTGEKRLASMLPLLAAVRSFYSTPGFTGPRMAFIDELDAALDKNNLRTLLHLLRDWDFDVIATLPSMSKLLVPEVRTTAIHKIIKSPTGARFSVPYIWDGNGLPEAIRISTPTAPAPKDGADRP